MNGSARIVQRESEAGFVVAASCAPDPRLAPFVEGIYRGFAQCGTQPSVMRETPVPKIPIVFNLGALWHLTSETDGRRIADSFLSGLDEHYTLVESARDISCLQVDFTPLGALRLLNRPLCEIANRVVALEDVLGHDGEVLLARLREAAWDDRFALLDAFFLRRFAASEAGSGELAWAWRKLRSHHGQIAIGAMAGELGWSHKRLIGSFRRDFGLTPRRAGRVMRFARAVRLLRAGDAARRADLALDCGYYDQAHLNRDFRDFAGVTPSEFLRGLLPDPVAAAAPAR
ncbi:MAG TPA: AraC family transcriptional regulator [Rhizomicrobium sp.]|jgi:AraC-like DNA-binding protein